MSSNLRELTPIFLLSLPRSGSTFVQRVLGSHTAIATASEPWILLPYLYTLREKDAYANYGHHRAVEAIADYYSNFQNGRDDYLLEIRKLALRMYARSSAYDRQQYFLDKTPRYHLIVEDIMQMFPDGKFIFLWRNPLSIVASIMQTWGHGKWNLHRFHIDLIDGIHNLVSAYQSHAHRVYSVRYEDLLDPNEVHWENIFNYLELPFDKQLLTQFYKTMLNGRYGDPTGVQQYQSVSQEPLTKWRKVITNPLRRYMCRRYLRWLGEERLDVMGYDLDLLTSELDQTPMNLRFIGSDIIRIAYGAVYRYFEPQILRRIMR